MVTRLRATLGFLERSKQSVKPRLMRRPSLQLRGR
jgi:hypothetical protein